MTEQCRGCTSKGCLLAVLAALLLLHPGIAQPLPVQSFVAKVAKGRLSEVELDFIGRGYNILDRNEKHSFLVVAQQDATITTAAASAAGLEEPSSSAARVPGWEKYSPSLPASGSAERAQALPPDAVTVSAASAALAGSGVTADTLDSSAQQLPSYGRQQVQGNMPGSGVRAAAASAFRVKQQLRAVEGVESVDENVYVYLFGRPTPHSQQQWHSQQHKQQHQQQWPVARSLKAVTSTNQDSETQAPPLCVFSKDQNPDLNCGKLQEDAPYWVKMVEADTEAMIQISKEQRNKVLYCVMDTGLDRTNPEFDPDTTSGCEPGAQRPDGSQRKCKYMWWNDLDGHGTHTSGSIAAKRNGVGIFGVSAEGAQIYHHNMFGEYSGFAYSDIVTAWDDCIAELDYRKAATNTPDMKLVISMSFGGQEDSGVVSQAANKIATSRPDVLLVAAAGNGDENNRANNVLNYPAAYSAVVSVSATAWDGSKTGFATYNSDVEWTAPGVEVLSTIPLWTVNLTKLNRYNLVSAITVDPFTPPEYLPDILTKQPPLHIEGSSRVSMSGQLVDCGLGIDNCTNAAGKICLMQRGNVSYCAKVKACAAGGGIGAIVYGAAEDVACDTEMATVEGKSCPAPPQGWPVAVSMSFMLGTAIKQALSVNPATTVTITVREPAPYRMLTGTSMATPIAAGVAGLVWSAHTNCTAAEVRAAVSATAQDLGSPGRDVNFGFGLVKALAAHNYLLANPCVALLPPKPSPSPPSPSPAPQPVDCVGSWTDWSQCSKECGPGFQTSLFRLEMRAFNGGKPCEAADGAVRTANCTGTLCPVACKGKWNWGPCDQTCGGGTQQGTYEVVSPAVRGGAPCEASTGDQSTQACNTFLCVLAVNDFATAVSGDWTEINVGANDVVYAGPVRAMRIARPSRPVTFQIGTAASTVKARRTSKTQLSDKNGVIMYLSEPGFVGNDVFTYTTTDAYGGQSTANVVVTVVPARCAQHSCTGGTCDPEKGRCICGKGMGMKPVFAPNPSPEGIGKTPMVPACRYPDFKAVAPFNLNAVSASKGTTVAVTFEITSMTSTGCLSGDIVTGAEFVMQQQQQSPKCASGARQLKVTKLVAGKLTCFAGEYSYAVEVPQAAGCYSLLLQLGDGSVQNTTAVVQ